ncbi:hypothetical protein PRELSG_0511300 [Plasmodium relictum]|uniref:C2 NT-type domain-containing protein n=1 Tax=Plasmodium relictum TaxID=85471 RepID=A0A1J1H265_PLARL|nr:hypothetical protein PRELSG_0511300 [Plasmodium relictum]CRG98955.1 hypothetical protein PRELSG_0511300 [Plasmodium relictum]
MGKVKNIMKYLNTSAKFRFELSVDYINLKSYENMYVTFELVKGSAIIKSDEKILLKNKRAYFKRSVEIKLTLYLKKHNKSYENNFFFLIFYIINNDEKYILGKCKINFSEFININQFYYIKLPIKNNLLNKGFVNLKIKCYNLEEEEEKNKSEINNYVSNSSTANYILRKNKNILEGSVNENNYKHIDDNNNNNPYTLHSNENYIPCKENNNMNHLNEINIYNIKKKDNSNVANLNQIKWNHTTLNNCKTNKNGISNNETQENSKISNNSECNSPHNYNDVSIIPLKKCINDSFKKLKEMNKLSSKTIFDINKREIKEDLINKNYDDEHLNYKVTNEELNQNLKNYGVSKKENNNTEKKKAEIQFSSDHDCHSEIQSNKCNRINKEETESDSNLKVHAMIGNMEKAIRNSQIIENMNYFYLKEEMNDNGEKCYNKPNRANDDELDKQNFYNLEDLSESKIDFQIDRELSEISDDTKLNNHNINKKNSLVEESNESIKTFIGVKKNLELLSDKRNEEIKILLNEISQLEKNSQLKEEDMKKLIFKILKNYVKFSKKKCEEFEFFIKNLKQLLFILNAEEFSSDIVDKKRVTNRHNGIHSFEKFTKKDIKINHDIIFNEKCEILHDNESIPNENIILRNFKKIDNYCNIVLDKNINIFSLCTHFETISEYINSLFILKKKEVIYVMQILINIFNGLIEKQKIPEDLKKKKYNCLVNIEDENIKYLSDEWNEKFINEEETTKENISKLEKEKINILEENKEFNNNYNILESIPFYSKIGGSYEKSIANDSTIKKLTDDVNNVQQIIEELKNSFEENKKYVSIKINNDDLIKKIINQYNIENGKIEVDGYPYVTLESIINQNILLNVEKKKIANMKKFSNLNIEKTKTKKYHKKIKELERELMNTKLLFAQSETKREQEINELKKKYVY